MSLKLHVIHAKEFVKLTPDGEFDFDATLDLLIEVASVESEAHELDILLDFRQARVTLTTTDIWYLAQELGKRRTLFREKVALLVGPDQKFDNAKFFELCASNRGVDVCAFNSYEEAINRLFPSSEIALGDDSTG